MEENRNGREVLGVRVSGMYYGLELSCVEELLRDPRISPMPWLPEYFVGVCGWKGGILPVASLEDMAGGSEEGSAGEKCMDEKSMDVEDVDGQNGGGEKKAKRRAVIVVRGGGYQCGFLVKQNVSVLFVSEDRRLEGEEENEDRLLKCFGKYSVGDEVVALIDADETLKGMVVCE